eukprot:1212061-Amphidinium_carterae.1
MPIWWPEVDLELLRGSGMHQAVVETKQRVLRRYHEITARCAAFGEMFTQEDQNKNHIGAKKVTHLYLGDI